MLSRFQATDFRCIESAELTFDSHYNLIFGANASGKTSLLEALAYLGRGKSFRGASTSHLIRHGCKEFVLFGEVVSGASTVPVGVSNGDRGLEVRVNGAAAAGAAALAEALPLQAIDPEVHSLVAGGPEGRRRFLDWIAFHVEQEHLTLWRRYRRILKQRNAALRGRAAADVIKGWDTEFVSCSEMLDASRQKVLALATEGLEEQGMALLEASLGFEYRRGWAADLDLAEVLAAGLERDYQYGATQAGPHRADLKIRYDERQARKLVSRGQQKLLASAMILAATDTVQTSTEQPMLLLLDDPAAELDGESLARLMASVAQLGCQVIATSLDPTSLSIPDTASVFHVEQGVVTAIS